MVMVIENEKWPRGRDGFDREEGRMRTLAGRGFDSRLLHPFGG